MEAISIFKSNIKWRIQNPQIIVMSIIQPMLWLLLFSTMFGNLTGTGNYSTFSLSGIYIMLILSSAGMGGISNYSWKQSGVFLRIYSSPAKRSFIILGHILDSSVITTIELIVLSLASLFLGVRVKSGFLGILLILLTLICTQFFVSALSYALSMVINNENTFIAIINTFMMPLFFASTALVPIESVPGILKLIVRINPFTYSINTIRNLILESSIDYFNIFLIIIGLLILCIFSFALAIRNLKRTGVN
jgi:ABC-2 type transport system permease protein